MLYGIIGLPGPLTSWCREVVASILKTSGISAHKAHIPSGLGDLSKELLLRDASHLVFSVSRPDTRFADVLLQTKKPLIYAQTDPKRSFLHLTNSGKMDPRTAVRSLSGDCSCISKFIGAENVVQVTESAVRQHPDSVVKAIAKAHGVALSEPAVQQIIQALAALAGQVSLPENGGNDPTAAIQSKFPEGIARCATFLLGGFEGHLDAKPDTPLIATKELFLVGDKPEDHVDAPLDMTGRPRFIVFGPYIHIPVGTWLVRLVVSFSEEALGIPAVVDIGASDERGFRELSRTHIIASTAGRTDISLSFQNDNPLASLQVRLATEKSVFDGLIAIGFAEFRRKVAETDEELEVLLPET